MLTLQTFLTLDVDTSLDYRSSMSDLDKNKWAILQLQLNTAPFSQLQVS